MSDRLRGLRRVELADRLARRLDAEHATVTALAAAFECRPSAVRRLLAEAGVQSRRLLIGVPDDEVTVQLARRFKQGVPVQELRLVTGIDERAIRTRLRAAGVTLAQRRRRCDLTASTSKLIELYGAGLSLCELAARSGGSYGMVRRLLLDAGVQLRGPGGRL